jgi:D-alanyl-D-alanine endopeptidase (penicillin-binding protein 7)
MTKYFGFILAVSLFLAGAGTASAQANKAANFKSLKLSQIRSYSAAVIDDSTGQLLFGKRENEEKPVASITKILGANVFLSTNPNLNSKVKMESADEVGGGRLRLPVGTTTQCKNFLYSSLVGSANNSATALMRLSGLGKSNFIRRMNSLADSVGANAAKFVDPSGISPNNQASAKELGLIGRKVYTNSYLCKISSTKSYSFYINGGKGSKNIVHTSPIVNRNESGFKVLAAKTGYLPEVGNNLLVKLESKSNSKAKIIVVLMGAGTRNATTLDASRIGNWAFNNYRW